MYIFIPNDSGNDEGRKGKRLSNMNKSETNFFRKR